MSQKIYYKIIGNNHGNFPYREGEINSLTDTGEIFNPDPECSPGGLYFCEIEHIFSWLNYGNKVCEITLPEDAQVVKVGDKFKADKIRIEKIFDIDFDYLVEKGANIHASDDFAFLWAAGNGNLDIVKYLLEEGANIHADDDHALRWAADNGHLNIVKYLVEKGANIHADDDHAFRWAAESGHLNIVKYLVEKGANIHASYNYAFRWAAKNGHLDVVEYLKSVSEKIR